MIIKLPIKSMFEQDALTPWKKYYIWKAGQRKFAKRQYNKRVRRMVIL